MKRNGNGAAGKRGWLVSDVNMPQVDQLEMPIPWWGPTCKRGGKDGPMNKPKDLLAWGTWLGAAPDWLGTTLFFLLGKKRRKKMGLVREEALHVVVLLGTWGGCSHA